MSLEDNLTGNGREPIRIRQNMDDFRPEKIGSVTLDYSGVFDEILNTFASEYTLTRVKTTNMGSLFRLTYDLTLRENVSEKELIDQLRCRNGNLEIMLSCQENAPAEL